jgi:hypothetical protein
MRRVGLALVLAGAMVFMLSPVDASPATVTSAQIAAFRTCTLNPLSSTSTAGIDTFADQGSPTTIRGTQTTMNVTSAATLVLADNERAHLKFDLSRCNPAIPSSATVSSALLRLFVTALPGSCRTHDLFTVTSSWTESGTGALTWNNQPFGTSLNNPSTASRVAFLTIGTPVGCTNRTNNSYISGFDVTSDVQGFVSGTKTNHGWMIRDDSERAIGLISSDVVTYVARETANATRAPQLVVNYR